MGVVNEHRLDRHVDHKEDLFSTQCSISVWPTYAHVAELEGCHKQKTEEKMW